MVKRKGSPTMLIFVVVVLLPTTVVATVLGAGPVAVVGGFASLFGLIALLGDALRPDLRLATWVVPLLFVGAVGPRLLSEASRPAAMVLVIVLVFLASMVPLRGPRFMTVGLGLGMTTLFSYAFAPVGAFRPVQLVIAAATGVVVALLWRIVFGIADPSKPTRAKIADVLVAEEPPMAAALAAWLDDGRPRWLGIVLGAASRYRLTAHAAEVVDGVTDLDALRERAARLADEVRARRTGVVERAGGTSDGGYLEAAGTALDDVAGALEDRDATPAELDRDETKQFRHALLHPSETLRSVQFRHAVRTSLGVLVMLFVTASLPHGDPLLASALMTTFSILQASWRDTLAKAVPRIVGVTFGSIGVALVLLVVPSNYLVVPAVIALCIGFWNITARPAVGNGFMVMVSVGFSASSRDLDPRHVLVEFLVLTVTAVVVGVLLGFLVVPALRPAPLPRRIEEAVADTVADLRAASAGMGRTDPRAVTLRRNALRSQRQLVPDREGLDDRQSRELDRLRAALGELNLLTAVAPLDASVLERVLEVLATKAPVDVTHGGGIHPGVPEATLVGLAEQAHDASRYLLTTLRD